MGWGVELDQIYCSPWVKNRKFGNYSFLSEMQVLCLVDFMVFEAKNVWTSKNLNRKVLKFVFRCFDSISLVPLILQTEIIWTSVCCSPRFRVKYLFIWKTTGGSSLKRPPDPLDLTLRWFYCQDWVLTLRTYCWLSLSWFSEECEHHSQACFFTLFNPPDSCCCPEPVLIRTAAGLKLLVLLLGSHISAPHLL